MSTYVSKDEVLDLLLTTAEQMNASAKAEESKADGSLMKVNADRSVSSVLSNMAAQIHGWEGISASDIWTDVELRDKELIERGQELANALDTQSTDKEVDVITQAAQQTTRWWDSFLRKGQW